MARCGGFNLDTHMKFDLDAVLRYVTLRPRKVSEEEKRHGTFNRRMIAATIDALLVTALISPVVDMVFLKTYGTTNITIQDIVTHANAQTDSAQAVHAFLSELQSSGLLERLVVNFKWQVFVFGIYTTLCWHYWAATPGKLLCGLKIIDAKTGAPMKDWQSILRFLGYFISSLPLGLGFFWIGLNKKRRGWHDYLAGTMVVRSSSVVEVVWKWLRGVKR